MDTRVVAGVVHQAAVLRVTACTGTSALVGHVGLAASPKMRAHEVAAPLSYDFHACPSPSGEEFVDNVSLES